MPVLLRYVPLLALLALVALPTSIRAASAEPLPPTVASAQEKAYSLGQLLALALTTHPAADAARAQREAAEAGIVTAQAFPNPELEYLGGPAHPNSPGNLRGGTYSVSVTQPLDLPWVRAARIGTAEAGLRVAEAEYRGFLSDVAARVKLQYYDVLRREAELAAAREDQRLMEDIRGRIALLVNTGESARYELIKADAEMLAARNRAKSAHLRVIQAKAGLRQFVGEQLPAEFRLDGQLPAHLDVQPLPRLREEVLQRNPGLAHSRHAAEQAEAKLALERRLRSPAVALKASRESDTGLRMDKIGVVVTIPLWDRRAGPVAEASAQARRSRYALEQQRFTLLQSLESAYQQYEIATSQVAALEAGIVRQAESALMVAEVAYRHGERSILDYLDAQRVYRAARNELITARFEQAAAVVELDRLRAAARGVSGEHAAAALNASSPLPAASGR